MRKKEDWPGLIMRHPPYSAILTRVVSSPVELLQSRSLPPPSISMPDSDPAGPAIAPLSISD